MSGASEARPTFSVVVPVHNKGPYVLRALESVLGQRCGDFELIVIDDASSDDSLEQIRTLHDARLRVLTRATPGAGGYAARNLGIASARAEWVCFLDADDEWLPQHLERCRTQLAAAPGGVLATGWIDSWPDGHRAPCGFVRRYADRGALVLDFPGFLRESVADRSPLHANVVVARRGLWEACGGFPAADCRRGGDIVAWLRLVRRAGRLRCLPEPTAVYHREASAVTRGVAPEVEDNCIRREVAAMLPDADRQCQRLLRQLANLHLRYGLVRRAAAGTLAPAAVRAHYASGSPWTHLFFTVYARLPGALQRALWARYRAWR